MEIMRLTGSVLSGNQQGSSSHSNPAFIGLDAPTLVLNFDEMDNLAVRTCLIGLTTGPVKQLCHRKCAFGSAALAWHVVQHHRLYAL